MGDNPHVFSFLRPRLVSVQAKATTLVTTRVYSRIRNPIYFFGAMFILGIIIWMGRPWLLPIFAVLIPLQVVRSRKEERVLTEKFGAAYLDYKQKTWFWLQQAPRFSITFTR